MALLGGATVVLTACGAGQVTSALPGQGKPSIVLGAKSSVESVLLGELYAQAFRARGYIVDLNPNLGDTQQTNAAFASGQITAYPEYLGELAATDAGEMEPLSSEMQAEQIASRYELSHRATVMMPVTPFSHNDQLVVLTTFAQQKHLSTIADLGRLPSRLKLGGEAAAQTRYAGYAGVTQAYRLTNLQFVPLAAGPPTYAALDSHVVNVAEVPSTDPQLVSGTYSALTDPQNIFGYQHVALIINSSLLKQLGPAFERTYTALTTVLTVSAMQMLNQAVAIKGKVPASVAHAFLVTNRLVSA